MYRILMEAFSAVRASLIKKKLIKSKKLEAPAPIIQKKTKEKEHKIKIVKPKIKKKIKIIKKPKKKDVFKDLRNYIDKGKIETADELYNII